MSDATITETIYVVKDRLGNCRYGPGRYSSMTGWNVVVIVIFNMKKTLEKCPPTTESHCDGLDATTAAAASARSRARAHRRKRVLVARGGSTKYVAH